MKSFFVLVALVLTLSASAQFVSVKETCFARQADLGSDSATDCTSQGGNHVVWFSSWRASNLDIASVGFRIDDRKNGVPGLDPSLGINLPESNGIWQKFTDGSARIQAFVYHDDAGRDWQYWLDITLNNNFDPKEETCDFWNLCGVAPPQTLTKDRGFQPVDVKQELFLDPNAPGSTDQCKCPNPFTRTCMESGPGIFQINPNSWEFWVSSDPNNSWPPALPSITGYMEGIAGTETEGSYIEISPSQALGEDNPPNYVDDLVPVRGVCANNKNCNDGLASWFQASKGTSDTTASTPASAFKTPDFFPFTQNDINIDIGCIKPPVVCGTPDYVFQSGGDYPVKIISDSCCFLNQGIGLSPCGFDVDMAFTCPDGSSPGPALNLNNLNGNAQDIEMQTPLDVKVNADGTCAYVTASGATGGKITFANGDFTHLAFSSNDPLPAGCNTSGTPNKLEISVMLDLDFAKLVTLLSDHPSCVSITADECDGLLRSFIDGPCICVE